MNDIISNKYIKKRHRKISNINKNFGWNEIYYVNDFSCYFSVYNHDRISIKDLPKIKNILKTMELNESLKENNIELSKDNLKIYEMLTYPCSYTENDFSYALKHKNHLKRNNVKINRFIV